MCGIVAALPIYPEGVVAAQRFSLTGVPRPELEAWSLAELDATDVRERVETLSSRIAAFRATVEAPAHAAWLAQDATSRAELVRDVDALAAWAAGLTGELARVSTWSVEGVQGVQVALRALSDAVWALQFDVLSLIETAAALSGRAPTPRTLVSYLAVLRVLASINRLEVRGRDSAGISIWVSVDPADAAVFDGVPARDDLLLRDGSCVRVDAGAVFTYKHAAVVGRLGDNVDALLASIRSDSALHRALACASARVTVLAHTRWASVGRISEPNAHPVDSRDADGESPGPYTVAALNGDIDNYLSLRTVPGQVLPPVDITTDAKIIPLVVAKTLTRRAGAAAVAEAVAPFEGSMAIALVSQGLPDAVQLVVKGSGQGLYVGLADSGLYVASEVYGLVGVTDRYLRVDGGRADGARNLGSVLELSRASSVGTVRRFDGDGTPWAVRPDETSIAEVTSRDLALGDEEHYLAKEIKEAAASFEKTLLGRIQTSAEGNLEATLATESYPDEIRRLVESGGLNRIIVTGQGTAAVAARGIAYLAERVLDGRITVGAAPATELSISGLSRDMSRTLVVAISQSGSTTDTNRCVDLAKERGASVISILNRRDSDLAAKSAGVIYTSDGRDIEMAVASTKAFYSQVAAGCLLALRVARSAGTVSPAAGDRLLRSLRLLPDQLRQVGQGTDSIAAVAAEVACTYPSWAVVGSGPNSVAASEVRIKLSELCYKTVSVDAIEDKKHIDLSAEALVVALVAGAQPNHLADLAKEIEIFGAHRNRPVVVADEGTEHLWPVGSTITVPRTRPELAWILSTAAGHLFSYHMARAIDAAGEPLREALDVLEASVDGRMPTPYASSRRITTLIQTVLARAGRGELRGVLTSDVALELARVIAPDTTSSDAAPDGTDAIRRALTAAIDQLTRSIDTVKHQAKTVTVGTSRSDADVFDSALALALEAVDADTHALSLQTLRAVSAFSGVVRSATGATRYRVNGPMIEVIAKTGSAAQLRSRADEPTLVVGSKRRALEAGVARLVRGRSDGRIVVVVPEVSVSDHGSVGLTVLHVELDPDATVPAVIGAMSHMGDRWAELRAAASETSPSFDEKALAGHPIEDLLFLPVEDLAARLES